MMSDQIKVVLVESVQRSDFDLGVDYGVQL